MNIYVCIYDISHIFVTTALDLNLLAEAMVRLTQSGWPRCTGGTGVQYMGEIIGNLWNDTYLEFYLFVSLNVTDTTTHNT